MKGKKKKNPRNRKVKTEKKENSIVPTSLNKEVQLKGLFEQSKLVIVGNSVIGKGHIREGLPCQDNFDFCSLDEFWSIAIVSDGAGSRKYSDIGSKIATEVAIDVVKEQANNLPWFRERHLPSQTNWRKLAIQILEEVLFNMKQKAVADGIQLRDYGCTIILTIFCKEGILVANIGDGRGAYLPENGNWSALFKPFKGEEANQTTFITDKYTWDNRDNAIGTNVIIGPIKSLAIMTDGCENACFLLNQWDEQKGYNTKLNEPYPQFFNPLVETISSSYNNGVDFDTISSSWLSFLRSGTPALENEIDDKSMILAVYC